MVMMNGNPKRANGWRARLARYLEAIVLADEEGRNFLDWKTAIVTVYWQSAEGERYPMC